MSESKKPAGALHKLFRGKPQMDQYRAEVRSRCAAVGLNLNDRAATEKTAREISQIIRDWLAKK